MASEPVALSTAARRPRPAGAATRRGPRPWLKTGVFLGAVVPLISMAWRASRGELQANAIAQIENELGLTALVFLIASLACTPARRFLNWTWQMPVRRELGLFAFFYALLHFLSYLVLDEFFDWITIFADVIQRPFITVGFLALVLMVPLAVTSTSEWVRKLGFRKWQRLHQLAYVAGVLAVVHLAGEGGSNSADNVRRDSRNTFACACGLLDSRSQQAREGGCGSRRIVLCGPVSGCSRLPPRMYHEQAPRGGDTSDF
jgi:sulfoxide reductase heme-binding subunit YedZ